MVAGLAAAAACSAPPADRSESPDPREDAPLQPLVYTEDPDHTPEAAAVRERRLMRRLLEGAGRDGSNWGALDSHPRRGLPELGSAEKLGRVLFEAFVEHDDRRWDHLFINPRDYAALVQIDLEKARKFVDGKQADAREARRAMRAENPSEAPRGGLSSIFSFRRLELGEGRTLQGPVAEEDEVVAQHWDNRLYFGHAEADVEFMLRIPKIIRIHRSGNESKPKVRLGVTSDIELGPRLRVFLRAGLHLKPELLRSFEYPLPLAVGNYWRYRRRLSGADSKPGRALPERLKASHVTMRVQSVDRYTTRRLVHLRFAYNDADLTRSEEFWLTTPRRIYDCPRPCRRHVDDLAWLLGYLRRQTPIFKFPLQRSQSWGSAREGSRFEVAEEWENVEVPAGSFFGTLRLEGAGALRKRVPFHRVEKVTRYFAPSKGVVRRRYRFGPDERDAVVEELVDYRIMSR